MCIPYTKMSVLICLSIERVALLLITQVSCVSSKHSLRRGCLFVWSTCHSCSLTLADGQLGVSEFNWCSIFKTLSCYIISPMLSWVNCVCSDAPYLFVSLSLDVPDYSKRLWL